MPRGLSATWAVKLACPLAVGIISGVWHSITGSGWMVLLHYRSSRLRVRLIRLQARIFFVMPLSVHSLFERESGPRPTLEPAMLLQRE